MATALRLFWHDDSGATTVDWVVLAGGSIALALIMMSTMNGSVSSVGDEIEAVLNGVSVDDLDDLGRGDSQDGGGAQIGG
jgi:Flp pilus assembly pilin Flp